MLVKRQKVTHQGAGRTLVRYITVIRTRFQELRTPSIVFNCLNTKWNVAFDIIICRYVMHVV